MEDDYRERIKELVEKNIIEYHGYQSDVKLYIKKCHCFVLPSYHEGMANTLLEAGAMGRPIITSDIQGCMEAVENDASGYLFQKQNVDSLYLVMERFIMLSYNDRKTMGGIGRKRMERIFDKKKVVQETIRYL